MVVTVIGGKAVDDVDILPQCLLIFERCQSRAHFTFTGESHQIVDAQEQVVRADFARHRQSLHSFPSNKECV